MAVTINGAIVLSNTTPGVTPESQGTTYAFDNGDFTGVLNDLTFTGNLDGESIGPGSMAMVGDVEYTLVGIYDFFATGTTVNLESGDEAPFQGQFVALRLEDPDGDPLNLLVPANSLIEGPDTGWTGDPVNSVNVFSQPTDELYIYSFPNDEGEFESKLSGHGVDIPCFTAGTLIDTQNGPVAVEALGPGDLVLTRDNGYLPVRWCGSRAITAAELATTADLAPVLIAAGALGNNLPERDTRVSPQHRMLVTGPRAELLFGEREVLVPAVHMVGLPGITRATQAVTYVHIMFEHHQIVRADGAWSESFQPADWALDGLQSAQRDEVLRLFPELASDEGRKSHTSARMILKQHEAQALLHAA